MSIDNKRFLVNNGLEVDGDTVVSGSVSATAFFGDGSGLTNVSGGTGGGLSENAVVSLIESTVDATYVQTRQSVDQLTSAQVETIIEQVVDATYVAARETGIDPVEVQNIVAEAINFRLANLEWNFSRTVSAPNFQEGTHTYSSTVGVLQPSLGSLQSHSLSGATTYEAHTNWESGESLTLHVSNSGGYSITWPVNVKWVGSVAPLCTTVGVVHLINFWKVGTQLYGAYVGEAS